MNHVEPTTFETPGLKIYYGPAFDIMESFAGGSVACIITDPPYWTLNKWREVGTTTRLGGHHDEEKREGWFETIDRNELYEMLLFFGRLLPKDGHAWVFADNEVQAVIQMLIREGETDFEYVKSYPVVKMRADGAGMKPGMGYHGRATHEYLVLCEKGRRRFTDENWPDVFMEPWTGGAESAAHTPDGKPYDTAKPVRLYRRLMELSSVAGETVLDPFAGSGTLIEAGFGGGRLIVCIDKSERSLATMRSRHTALARAGDLFAAEAGA